MDEIEKLHDYLGRYEFRPDGQSGLFPASLRRGSATEVSVLKAGGTRAPQFLNEFWTSRQRQASSLHEVSYRACFKPQLPRFFIRLFTGENEAVYDPFAGRGTTALEAALMGRRVISNDINPLSEILTRPRFFIPRLNDLETRLRHIETDPRARADIDLSMFFHPQTEAEVVSLRNYILRREAGGRLDALDGWIRMVATNRLTGHSSGFFSVYTLPPNQAASQENQKKINAGRNQKPQYRDIASRILRKSRRLIKDVSRAEAEKLARAGETALLLTQRASETGSITDGSVKLTVTSPPFLDIVNYAGDNWLRCWFNGYDAREINKRITTCASVKRWCEAMRAVFDELYRVTMPGGWVAFEVGEVRKGEVKLDRHILPLGTDAGFRCAAVIINRQPFTKTSNIWGVANNTSGTNTNRIALFCKAV